MPITCDGVEHDKPRNQLVDNLMLSTDRRPVGLRSARFQYVGSPTDRGVKHSALITWPLLEASIAAQAVSKFLSNSAGGKYDS